MNTFSILALSALISTVPAFAETQSTTATYQDVALNQSADLSFAFGDVKDLQATDMTLAEMQETEGAALAFAPLLLLGSGGGAAGAWKNHYDSYSPLLLMIH